MSSSVNLAEIMPEFDQFVEATRTANQESGNILFKNLAIDVVIAVIKDFLSCDNICYTQPYVGAFWITTLNGTKFLKNGTVFSAYFHPSKEHKAITQGYNGRKMSIAEGGKWAVCFQTKARRNNKAGYETAPFYTIGAPINKGDSVINTLGATFGKVGQSLSRHYADGHFACNFIKANC